MTKDSPKQNVRFRDAMPRPLLVTFLVVAFIALIAVIALMVKPPKPGALKLGERRSPPGAGRTHNVGRVAPAPIPSPHAPGVAACPAFERIRIDGGDAAFGRITAGLRPLCDLTGGSISAELRTALTGLADATIRFAGFARTGEEATSDLGDKVLYLNVRFARSNTPTILVAPILAHEGWHLSHPTEAITAASELSAREAELEACKLLIDRDKWIRNCDDAERIVSLGPARAISLLEAAGFPPA